MLLIFFICLTTSAWAQSKIVNRFQEKHKSGQALFFYPSTLRMINIEKNPDYYQLVSNIDKLQFLSFDKEENKIASETVKQLQQDIEKEGYEELFSMDDKNSSIHIYASDDSNEPEGIVGVIDNTQMLTLIHMEGFVDMTSLLKLMQSNFNFGKITQLMNTIANQENQKNND